MEEEVRHCLSLSDTVRQSAENVTELGASDVKCELLGQAKRVMDDSIGKTIALNDGGSRVVYLLCGPIENHEWFVTKALMKMDLWQRTHFKEKIWCAGISSKRSGIFL